MPIIQETTEIKANPEAVFDLIAQVDDFSLYTDVIKEIKAVAPETYRWVVQVVGIRLEWDVVLIECERPRHFAWRSLRGIVNSGYYHLEPSSVGTVVSFMMEYRLPNQLLEMALAPFIDHLVRRVGSEILSAVKQRLEHDNAKSQHISSE